MCGIVAYIGKKEAYPIIVEGLKRLEYRGYDSAGVSILSDRIMVVKKKGKVSNLEEAVQEYNVSGTTGIGHTRWATHGEPNDINAHPHLSGNKRLALIHNGIIENYATLKKALQKLGHEFISETDTEVLVHLIEEYQKRDDLALDEAVRKALLNVVGAYSIVVMDEQNPDMIVGARKSSPLVLGIGDEELFLASDATPIIKYTNKVVYLNDEEIVAIHRNGKYEVKNLHNEVKFPTIHELDLKLDELEKEGFDHYMLKEIYQQPTTIKESMRGRLNAAEGWVLVGGMQQYFNRILHAKRIIFAACGTSWHSALVGEYLFEELARIPAEVEYASELRYRNPIIHEDDVVIALSQSGETADTLAALELAKEKGALIYGIVNVVGSSIARITHCGSYIHAGPEIGVASTKAFTSQITVLTLMALNLGYKKGTITEDYFRRLLNALEAIPGKVEKVLKQNEKIRFIASEIKDVSNSLYLGRGYNFPVALEGALKLKEISYIHAEGYPAAEMKHGPIALIDENMPVIIIATNQSAYEKVISNIQEVKARKAIVISIIPEGEEKIKEMSDYYVEIPETEEPLTPLLSVIPLQLLAYHIAVMRGCDVDQPRNLAKSVTVE
ncbi:MAG: glutamine--fructose-6-phosphate transaminase (isomerizing) [Saprospiraceae bacterium]|nr:glutamine--fructose-6-phosphate transaminase (isomerizing) [Saprospiraceae bacterium]MBK7523597.1 glutamine--fructose-6-phosphate transaminase (isomerizing) [Saprospiraceae bacterium]MBK8371413.1 glutamine--fructose-6-phosphate transaminase (isomerizing) [Saprospiraceae bacterium]MBK8818783.1 glutamine--fructose-6-phosphate transaminase (isomerizing) [Saprospiraceae bacterium]MBK8853739.1 glutamine--fructose-6-phosphate transaminase (isomerizing) [Saprospiraceae bacterium]